MVGALCQCSSIADLERLDVAEDTLQQMQAAVQVLIEELGEDASREGLRDTPRVSPGSQCSACILI